MTLREIPSSCGNLHKPVLGISACNARHWTDYEQPGSYQLVGRIGTDKRASGQCLIPDEMPTSRTDPSTKISDIENVEIVFKDGVGYDSAKLIDSVRGLVGLR
jgi:hypothetical protein